ncbi:MAG: sugar phosphate isomerase/epimerase family protein [Planctomycetia bacterium]|nr:sugar phosphate isomerase/epimerase family protein [Planctomycetia bacterium]
MNRDEKIFCTLLTAITCCFALNCWNGYGQEAPNDYWPVGVIARYDEHGAGIELDRALTLDIDAVQIKTPFPEHRSPQDAENILKKVTDAGKRITSMQGGFTGESYKTIPLVAETVGLVPESTRAERMEQLRDFCHFAKKLNLNIVCFHFGVVPHDRNSAEWKNLVQTMRDVCDIAAQSSESVHLETGQETAESLLAFIEEVDRDNLFINFDPANMILYGCGDPIEALKKVGKYVKSVHCKDAKWAQNKGSQWGEEVPFGEGDVNAELFFQALAAINFKGALIIERENRNDSERQFHDAATGVELVKKLKEKYLLKQEKD